MTIGSKLVDNSFTKKKNEQNISMFMLRIRVLRRSKTKLGLLRKYLF